MRFIKRAQALGFSLNEVALLLGPSDGRHCAETKVIAEKKLDMVEEKINDLLMPLPLDHPEPLPGWPMARRRTGCGWEIPARLR